MNNPPIWRTEDAALLLQLRESAKIDSLVFSRLNAISLAQLRELEGQGEGGFYNPHIKANTGIKLLKKLGHERVHTDADTPPELSPPALATSDTRSRTFPAPVPRLATPETSEQPSSQDAPRRWPFRWVAGTLVLGGLVWLGTHLPNFKTTLDPRVRLASASTSTSANASSTIGLTAPPPPSKVAPSPTNVDAQTPAEQAPAAPACDAQMRQTSHTYVPTQVLKPANYVHFSATQDASLCVRDHKNQLTQLELKAGASRSVYGEPPFLVHSPKWSNLRVFFQGRQIGANLDDASHWVFKKSALPIPSPE